MKQQIFTYLKSYSTQPNDVDRLIISAYLNINKIEVKKNIFIKSYLITEEKTDEFEKLGEFVKILKQAV